MATLPKKYNTGTISVANGATAVTGTGTAWVNIVKADDVLRRAGHSVRIASVESSGALTLAEAWPGTSLVDSAYEIAITYDGPEFQLRTRELMEDLNAIDGYIGDGGLIFDTKANLDADLAHAANISAWVVLDATVANKGIYRKIGASGAGSWTRVADLPYSFIKATDAGNGTANAIQAATNVPVSSTAYTSMIVMNVFEANTGAVTVALNGAAAKSLKTVSGGALSANYLTAGMVVTFVDDGTNYRLISDVASAAIQAAAETAEANAEAAQAAAETARDQAIAVRAVFATKALAEAYSPASAPDFIRLEGRTSAGDHGGALYKKKSPGAQMLTNPGFDTDTAWTKGTGWAIASGVATKTAGTASDLSQAQTLVVGQEYIVSGTISGWTAGALTPKLTGGTAVNGTAIAANGSFSQKLTAVSGNNTLVFAADATFNGSIDNVTLQTSGQPVHAGKFSITLSDAVTVVWYEIAEEVLTPQMFGAVGDGVADDTTEIQATLDAGLRVHFLDANYDISDRLTLRTGHHITAGPGVTIEQLTASKSVFYALSKTDIVLDVPNALLIGEGTYGGNPGGPWTGMGNSQDRGIWFQGCSRTRIIRPRIRDCGSAGICLEGGSDHQVIRPTIEGTHSYSTPITSQGNFQCGIYVPHGTTHGATDGVYIEGPDISGVAQGVLLELDIGGTQPTVRGISIVAPHIHDVPGQHAFYITHGHVNIVAPIMRNIELSGVKVQAGNANQDIELVNVVGANGFDLGSQLFEVVTPSPYTGIIKNCDFKGTVKTSNRAASIGRNARNLTMDVRADGTTGVGISIADDNIHDIDITCNLKNIGLDGIAITATNSDGIKLRPTIRECNTTGATANGEAGIRVSSASAKVEVFNPDITDANTLMRYGLFHAVAGGDVKVRGSVKMTGAAVTGVRATGIISEWPTEAKVSGVSAAYTSPENVHSTQSIIREAVSTSATNVTLWSRSLADESAYIVRVELVGRVTGSSQRKVVVATGCFYRDGGGAATLQGAVDEDVAIASASFAGVYSLIASGNNVLLQVNSGGADTYNWKARVTVTSIEG